MAVKKEPKQVYNTRDKEADRRRLAKPVGKRTSRTGRTYYEYRSNRSDTEEERRLHGMIDASLKNKSNVDGDYHLDERKKTTPISRGFLSILRRYESSIHNNGFETIYMFDKCGNLTFSKKGNENCVEFSGKDISQFLKDKPYIATHNHPSDGSFSLADLCTAACYHIHEMRAVGSKHIYSITGFDRFKGDWKDIKTNYTRLISRIHPKYQKMFERVYFTPAGQRLGFEATCKKVSFHESHEMIRELAKIYPQLRYKRITWKNTRRRRS